MAMDRQDILRDRNKHLLKQLRLLREKLERPSGCSESRKKERRRQPELVVTLTDGDRLPAGAALAKPTVRFADAYEMHRGIQNNNSPPSWIHNYRGGTTEHTAMSDLLEDSFRYPRLHNKLEDTRPLSAGSSSVSDSKEQRDVGSRVTFHTDECEAVPALDRHHLQPLLGYDWIAGVLDTEDSVVERSDEFFKDLRVFQLLHKSECFHDAQFSDDSPPASPLQMGKNDPKANMDTHCCTFSYRINSRLFPVPLQSQECCPVCKKHKSSHPHTAAEPALVRVSIPRTTLLPSYKYKAHRRCSFDPSDSLGLPSHCLSGWSNTGQSTLPPPSSLDLRSSLKMKNSEGSLDNELQDLSAPTASDSRHFGPISDVSRLARHNFQHFSPRRKVSSTFYPV